MTSLPCKQVRSTSTTRPQLTAYHCAGSPSTTTKKFAISANEKLYIIHANSQKERSPPVEPTNSRKQRIAPRINQFINKDKVTGADGATMIRICHSIETSYFTPMQANSPAEAAPASRDVRDPCQAAEITDTVTALPLQV